MAINLSVNYSTAVESIKTLPGYLVQISFTPTLPNPVRYSTIGSVSCVLDSDGTQWLEGDVQVSGLVADVSSNSSGQLTLGVDATNQAAQASYVLSPNLGYAGRPVKIWSFDQSLVSGGTLSPADTVLIFEGVGNSASLNPLNVTVTLVANKVKTMFAPRHRMNSLNGFNHLDPKGTRISWGTEIFILE